jgi:hypothetical protein
MAEQRTIEMAIDAVTFTQISNITGAERGLHIPSMGDNLPMLTRQVKHGEVYDGLPHHHHQRRSHCPSDG